ncbi:hypothetical protein KKH36_01170 [Patescibacteria group bacterium]|nr:hypothetical protein [Patescibacteria group bacterium]
MEKKKNEGFVPEVWIYVDEDKNNHKVLFTEEGFNFSENETKDVYIKIAEILINTKLPVECTFLVGFYFEDDFSVGIEKIGDLIFEEDAVEIFQLDPNKEIVNVKNELIQFFANCAGEFASEAKALQKEVFEKNNEFSRYFRVVSKLITG